MTKVVNKPFVVITGKEAIAKEINLIGVAGVKYDKRVHVAAVSCVNHIKEHGDNTLLLKLFKVLPDSFRRNSFLAWCEEFGGITVITKNEEGKALKKDQYSFKKRIDVTDDMIKGGMANAPMTYKKSSEGTAYAGFNDRDELIKYVQRAKAAQKKVADGKVSSDSVKIDPDVLQFIEYFISAGKVSDVLAHPVAKPATVSLGEAVSPTMSGTVEGGMLVETLQ